LDGICGAFQWTNTIFKAAFDASLHSFHGGETLAAAPCSGALTIFFFSLLFSLFNLEKYATLAKLKLEDRVIC
jgi:hypothetical protein